MKFDASAGCPPVTGAKPDFSPDTPPIPPAWMLFTTNFLILGLEPVPTESRRINKAGVWLLPLSQIEPAINEQKQKLLVEQQKAINQAAEAKKLDDLRRQAFLRKYDRNHNGIIDPDEEAAAMDDPYFIKFRLEQIHAQKYQ